MIYSGSRETHAVRRSEIVEHSLAMACSANMPELLKFLLINALGGFSIGIAAGIACIAFQDSGFLANQPLEAVLVLWAFGASFTLGAIGTGLAFLR